MIWQIFLPHWYSQYPLELTAGAHTSRIKLPLWENKQKYPPKQHLISAGATFRGYVISIWALPRTGNKTFQKGQSQRKTDWKTAVIFCCYFRQTVPKFNPKRHLPLKRTKIKNSVSSTFGLHILHCWKLVFAVHIRSILSDVLSASKPLCFHICEEFYWRVN